MENLYRTEAGKQLVLTSYKEILADWPVPNRQYEVPTSFGPTFVIESGSRENPALLLLHGSVSNSFTWYGDVAALSKYYHVFAVDIIGEAGLSAPSRPTYESGAYPVWIKELLQGLQLETCSLAGLSLGGWLSLSFATAFPHQVDKLILLCPAGLTDKYPNFLLRAIFYSLLGKWGKTQLFKHMNGGKLPPASSGLEKGLAFTGLMGTHFKPRTGMPPAFDGEALSRLTMPILMLFGENDYLVPPQKSMDRLLKYAPHAETVLLPDAGHALVNQSQRILAFLQK